MSQGPVQGPALDFNQLKAMRAQQQGAKIQMILNLAVQYFINNKVESIPDAFTLAEQTLEEMERRYAPNESQNKMRG